jgi:hypothetical protein
VGKRRWNDTRLRDCAFAYLATKVEHDVICQEYEIERHVLDQHIEAAKRLAENIADAPADRLLAELKAKTQKGKGSKKAGKKSSSN